MQLLLWVGIVLTTVVLKGLLVWVLEEPLASWGNFMLGPLEDHTKKHGHTLELIVVMMIIPFVLCAMQLWIQDSFLQSRKRGQGLHRFSEEDLEGGQRQYRQAAASAGPLFLLSDAFWGPDSHRYGKAPLTEQTGGTSQDGSSHAFTLQGMATISPPTQYVTKTPNPRSVCRSKPSLPVFLPHPHQLFFYPQSRRRRRDGELSADAFSLNRFDGGDYSPVQTPHLSYPPSLLPPLLPLFFPALQIRI